jgi:hypothetical protein
MRLDWLKERASQQFFRFVFLPGLINPADFFTKILPVYRHIAALPFLHGTPIPYPFCTAPPPHHIPSSPCIDAVVAMSLRQGLPYHSLPITSPRFFLPSFFLTPPASRLTRLCYSLVLSPSLSRGTNAPTNPGPTTGCWSSKPLRVLAFILAFVLPDLTFSSLILSRRNARLQVFKIFLVVLRFSRNFASYSHSLLYNCLIFACMLGLVEGVL